jgi:hypothetical protein
MVNFARIQHKIDHGLGIAAKHLGPPYSGYRVTVSSSGDFPSGWTQVGTNVRVFLRRTTDAKIFSALLASGTLWFDVIANMEPYLLGDVFQLTDGSYKPGVAYGVGATSVPGTLQYNGYALAWHAPVDEPVGARCDRRVQIYRPFGPPDLTVSDGGKTWRGTAYVASPLVLAAGVFAFQSAYSGIDASFVPAGIASTDRPPRGHLFPATPHPGDLQVPRYFMYVPPLPGYIPSEGDRIIEESGARYIVTNAYHQEAGVVGNQLGVERRTSEN